MATGDWIVQSFVSLKEHVGDKIHMDKGFEVDVHWHLQRGQPLKRRCIHLKMLAVMSQPLESGALSIHGWSIHSFSSTYRVFSLLLTDL